MSEAETTSRERLYFDRLPVIENRTYRSAAEARAVSTGSVRLAQEEVSAKGVPFCAHMLREGASVDSVVDITPEKQGRFLALTGLEVLSPQAVVGNLIADDNVFVMNRNYPDEIVEMSGDRCRYIVYPRSPESPCETLG